MGTRWLQITCIFSSLLTVIPATCSTAIISKILNIFSNIYCSSGIYIKSSAFSKRKDHLHCLNILQIIDCDNYGYLNAWKLLVYNIFGQSRCSRVTNTAEISTATLSPWFSISPRQIELENISFSQMWNLRTVGNMLTADQMYSRHNWDKFPQYVQTPLSQKS